MRKVAVKFCGGCNPGYDRGAAYQKIREAVADRAQISLPAEGESYDALLIIRGCTGCPLSLRGDRRKRTHSLRQTR